MTEMKDWKSVLYITDGEYEWIEATLSFVKSIGLINDDSFKALENRCMETNSSNKEKVLNKETVYGIEKFNLHTYLQYELTQFKLDFVQCKSNIDYDYKLISKEQKIAFFEENKKLFTRWTVSDFEFEEVEMVIEKRIREAEYDENIKKILYKLS